MRSNMPENGRPLAPGPPEVKPVKHSFMMRTRIAISQHENWSGYAFENSMTLSAFIRFAADLVAAGVARPNELREFTLEVQHLLSRAHDISTDPAVHQHLEEASRVLQKLMRIGN
jgi:hypothetical protein